MKKNNLTPEPLMELLGIEPRPISSRESELLIAFQALDDFRSLENGGKELDENSVIQNIWDSITDVPEQYYDDFMESYSSYKNDFSKNTYLVYDLPDVSVIVCISCYMIGYQESDIVEVKFLQSCYLIENGKIYDYEN